jgi:alkylated DNA repair protein (DNA oxidative demethylase)
MLHLKEILTYNQQLRLVEMCREIAKVAPFITPVMPSGQPMNCQQTSCGQVGWTVDKQGYRYSHTQPNGRAFPAMPDSLANLADYVASLVDEPSYFAHTCLINHYQASSKSKLGLHQDNTEVNLEPCIISISIGDDCEFVMRSAPASYGGTNRSDPTKTIILRSGDILVMHGQSRLAYHGVKRIIPNTAPKGLLKNNGRLNMTIRQVF